MFPKPGACKKEKKMAKKILIMGAGAVGAYVGGYMARLGEDVIFVDPWPEHVAAINNDGLTLSGLTEPECFNTPARAISLTDMKNENRKCPISSANGCRKNVCLKFLLKI